MSSLSNCSLVLAGGLGRVAGVRGRGGGAVMAEGWLAEGWPAEGWPASGLSAPVPVCGRSDGLGRAGGAVSSSQIIMLMRRFWGSLGSVLGKGWVEA
jgi:hypothetical protein